MRGMRAFDLTLAWEGKIRERFTISPSVGFYNHSTSPTLTCPEMLCPAH